MLIFTPEDAKTVSILRYVEVFQGAVVVLRVPRVMEPNQYETVKTNFTQAGFKYMAGVIALSQNCTVFTVSAPLGIMRRFLDVHG